MYKHEGEAAMLLEVEHGMEVGLEEVFKKNVHEEEQRSVQDEGVDDVAVDPIGFLHGRNMPKVIQH